MSTSKPLRILYMEDDEGLARLLQKKMRREGFEVDLACDGKEGLAMFEKHPYDVLFLDYRMPGYSGLEVIRYLAAKGKLPPTVMVTGAGDETTAVEAMKRGYAEAARAFGGTLPEIAEDTIELAVERLEQWATEPRGQEEALDLVA